MISMIEAICKAENIYLDPLPGLKRLKAVAMKVPDADGDIRCIGYDETLVDWDRISAIAHEIGHHVLGHFDDDTHLGANLGKPSEKKRRNEMEAQVFAATFTAMAMFMKHVQLLTGKDELHA